MPFEATRSISMQPAAAALVRARRFVALGTAGTISEAGDGVDVAGVALEESPNSSTAGVDAQQAAAAISVGLIDGSKIEIEAGEAIAIGDDIASDSQGRAKTSASGDYIQGKALTAAAAAGEIITFIANKAARAT